MLRSTLRTLNAHRSRFALPGVAVVIAVAFLTGSLVYGQSVGAAVERDHTTSQPDVSVRLTPEPSFDGEAPRLDDSLLRKLRRLPGARAARGTVEGGTLLVTPDGETLGDYQSTGVNWAPDRKGSDPRYPLTRGRGPRGGGEVAVDRRAAERAGYRVGDRIRVVADGRTRDVRLVGTFTARDSRTASGATLTAFAPDTARDLFAPSPGRYTEISLTASAGASETQLARQAEKLTPEGVTVQTRDQFVREAVRLSGGDKLTSLLVSFAGVGLFVSVFLVATSFTALSAARAREHALLRAVGATRRQVARRVLAEAALLGLVASALGYALGIGLATLMGRMFAVLGEGRQVPLLLDSPLPPLAACAVGVGVTLLSAYLPARRAGQVPPVAALRSELPPAPAPLRRRNLTGLLVTALGVALLVAAKDAQDLLYAGAPLLLVGLILLTPSLALGFTALLRAPLTRLAGVRGTLAVENARRTPRRTAATAATLMIGLALVTAVTVAVRAVEEHDAEEAAARMVADLQVTAVEGAEVGTDAARRLATLDGAEAVTPVVQGTLYAPGDRGDGLGVVGVNPRTVGQVTRLTVRQGSLADLDRGVAVSTEVARERHWRVGSRVSGSFHSGGEQRTLPVVALYDGPDDLTPALVPDRLLRSSARGGEETRVRAVLLKAAPGGTEALREAARRTLDNPALRIQDRADVRAEAGAGTSAILAMMYGLLSVTMLIGVLGVVNTMGMAVLERVRETGLLRAVGLDRRGVASLLSAEAVLISVFGSVLGLVAGGAIGVAGVRAQGGVTPVLPWQDVGLLFGAAALVGVLAALAPAVTAARTPVLRAIGTE
ncbi:ABC transporter permease [Streptomyces sp. NPDC005438]|uniref:ABC transporter permease n=1 Tax=Streptomyces sp. NPDC005438 TaxID=3156880 RepID=UPI0033BC79D9